LEIPDAHRHSQGHEEAEPFADDCLELFLQIASGIGLPQDWRYREADSIDEEKSENAYSQAVSPTAAQYLNSIPRC
jgi:hypothetical protein